MMMLGSDAKKIATIIVGGMEKTEEQKPKADTKDDNHDSVKVAAVRSFMQAVKDGDDAKAVDALEGFIYRCMDAKERSNEYEGSEG